MLEQFNIRPTTDFKSNTFVIVSLITKVNKMEHFKYFSLHIGKNVYLYSYNFAMVLAEIWISYGSIPTYGWSLLMKVYGIIEPIQPKGNISCMTRQRNSHTYLFKNKPLKNKDRLRGDLSSSNSFAGPVQQYKCRSINMAACNFVHRAVAEYLFWGPHNASERDRDISSEREIFII